MTKAAKRSCWGWGGALLLAALAAAGACGLPALAAPTPAASESKPAPVSASAGDLYGDYLAGRHAEQMRDYPAAASWFEKAITADPNSPELISRTFLMAVGAGNFDRAQPLAQQELKVDPTDALAGLVMIVERLKANDDAGAVKYAAALPSDGVHRFVGPLALAWTRMATGDLQGADAALQQLDKFNGFKPLKDFQLGLLYDFAGQVDKADSYYAKTLADNDQLNWRLTDAIANFYERHGKADKAKALYQKFIDQNIGSEIAQTVLSARPPGVPKAMINSATDGLAEAMFDLASVLNQTETIDLALIYDRYALWLQPDFRLAQLLLADVLSTQNEPAQSLAVLQAIPKNSPYSWSARLRAAADLEDLDRSDEAIAQLRAMAAEQPKTVGADIQLGDILRNKKRYDEAAAAYNEAIERSKADGIPDRWALFYDRGVSYERAGDWQKAEADLEQALALKPDQPLILNYLGYSWVDRGEKLDQGLKMIEKAVELRPEDGYIVDSLGWAHYRMGDYAGAVEYLERAVELVPSDSTINNHLGDAYWRTGRLTEARYQWRRALQFGPDKDDLQPLETKLEKGLGPPSTPASASPASAAKPGSTTPAAPNQPAERGG
ncbi:MAG TPA: tetratricopeptide repeat protein [Stellaceae bacterium]|nr:tetratricopeptide repeat protein [Stellaceae bacterium]